MAQHHHADHDAARLATMSAVRELDGAAVRGVLRQSLLVSGVDVTVTEVIMPVLKQVGDAWEAGGLGVLHEHFVSSAFRGVLSELRMTVHGPRERTVVLACPPHELHDLPLEIFGAMLHARSWRVVSLGANTPMTAIGDAVRLLRPDACVLAGVRRSAFESRMPSLTRLSTRVPVFLAGEGAVCLPVAPRGTVVLRRDLRAAAETVDAVGGAGAGRTPGGAEHAVG